MSKLKFKRSTLNHYHYITYVNGLKCNIYLRTDLALGHTIFKECFHVIQSLGINMTNLERKIIQNKMFHNDEPFTYEY